MTNDAPKTVIVPKGFLITDVNGKPVPYAYVTIGPAGTTLRSDSDSCDKQGRMTRDLVGPLPAKVWAVTQHQVTIWQIDNVDAPLHL